MSERSREILERLAKDLDAHPGDASPVEEPTFVGTWECHWCRKVAPVTPHGWDNICAECLAKGEKPAPPGPPAERPALEDPADSRPCGCEEVEGLRAQLDRVVALANRWEKHPEYALFRSFAHALQVAIEGEEAPPPAPPPSRVTLLEEIAEGVVDMLDGEPSGSDSLDWALEQYGYKPTKGVTEEQATAESLTDHQRPISEAQPEPWRVGRRIPEHVYIGDRPLVTMPTAELAALVVTAVNGLDPAQRERDTALLEVVAERKETELRGRLLDDAYKLIRDENGKLTAALARIAELEATQKETVAQGRLTILGLQARIARVEALRDTHKKQADGSVFSTALVEYLEEALR